MRDALMAFLPPLLLMAMLYHVILYFGESVMGGW